MSKVWNDELKQYANTMDEKYNLPEGTMHQIIQQESTGKLGLTSKAGAYGLTQLMPGTAKEMGVTDITDPYQQIEGGAKYYSQIYHNQAKGDPIVAAGMYNSGPNKKAYKTGNLNLLPIETQNYMKQFATGTAGHVPSPKSIGEQVLNTVISPAYGSNKKVLSPEEFNALPDTPTKKVLSPEEFNALPDTPQKQYSLKDPDTYVELAKNIVPSAVKLGTGTLEAGANLITDYTTIPDKLTNLSHVITGEIQKVIPGKSPAEALGLADAIPKDATKEFDKVFNNRYGNLQNVVNTMVTDPVGMAADVTSFGALSKMKLLPARSTTELVPHPISYVTDKALAGAGKVSTEVLNKVNKSNLTKAEIDAAYKAGKEGNLLTGFQENVLNKSLLPSWNSMSDIEKLSMASSAGLLHPASIGLFSPKLVSGAAFTAGTARRVPAAINKAIDITPGKGLLNQYEEEQQTNPIRKAVRSILY